MAKKARKTTAKRGKKSKAKKSKVKAAKKAAKKTKVARKKKKARKAKPSFGARISTGFHNVVDTVSDTVTGTGKLRKKMEQPGTDETE